jgi:type 1 glutamine amidotransferase
MNINPSHILLGVCLTVAAMYTAAAANDDPAKRAPARKIVLIAGPKSHGPVGNGIHDYPWSVKLLKVMFDNSNVADRVRVEFHLDGWPESPQTLGDADTIVVISDGRDGDKYEEAPHFQSDARAALIQKQIDRGCGFVTFHFSTFAPDKYAPQVLDWTGGYFDWEENGQRQWYSAIQTHETAVELATAEHPVLRGVRPFTMKEEFYFNIRFRSGDDGVTPLLAVPVLPGREPDGKVVAWAKQRADGGRGFGTTCGHFYDNWKHDDFRRTVLNAIAWTAHVDLPEHGVQSRFYTHEEITAALTGIEGTARATLDDALIRALIFAGNEAHKWHNWEKTTPAIKALLEVDARIKVDVSYDIEDLAAKPLGDYHVIVQNYVNWHDPRTLSDASRTALMNFLQRGGGLILVHFANGAWNFSLPEAGASDWPEYRRIVRRVWNHHGEGEAKSGHDAFGPFTVNVSGLDHAITAGLADFNITDELYFRQDGAEPIEPLITARSRITARDEPLAWTYTYGKGRVFQTLLGHSEETYDTFEAREMLRRAAAWCAQRPVQQFAPSGERRASAR